jgi:hypothetical protein
LHGILSNLPVRFVPGTHLPLPSISIWGTRRPKQ